MSARITINKAVFNISIRDRFEIEIPEKAKILKVTSEHNKLVIFYLGKVTKKRTIKKFISLPTGAELPQDNFKYIDTVFIDSGTVHIWEKGGKDEK